MQIRLTPHSLALFQHVRIGLVLPGALFPISLLTAVLQYANDFIPLPSFSMFALGLSFLERLSEFPLYGRDPKKFGDHGSYDPLLVTKLVDNYRSHPALLKISSQLFYDDELDPKGKGNCPKVMILFECTDERFKVQLIM